MSNPLPPPAAGDSAPTVPLAPTAPAPATPTVLPPGNSEAGRLAGMDPLALAKLLWPDVYFYDKQRDVIYSVWDNDETFVPAGNKLGKDFVSGFIALAFFLTRHPCRIITTSAKDDHLRVLWGEIGRYIQTSKYPLDHRQGGPLIVNHQDIRKIDPVHKERCPLSYLRGMVAGPDSMAAMQGHHIANVGDGVPRTLFVCDESSSVQDEYKRMADTWANRELVLGNTWPCDNFFKHAVKGKPGTKDKGGDVPRPAPQRGFYRRVIRIRAQDSPNVRYAEAEIAAGLPPSNRIIVPGVKDYAEYRKNREMWDAMQQAVSLDAEFYEGGGLMLFPGEWLDAAGLYAQRLLGLPRKARGAGCDPGEGSANTTFAAADEMGLIELVSMPTPDTSVIARFAINFMLRHGLRPSQMIFDRGGGGKQIADQLRSQGYMVRTVGFGESIVPAPRRGVTSLHTRVDEQEERYVYVNRRAQMYYELADLLDPSRGTGFAIPYQYAELRRQLAVIPKLYDREGRARMLAKNKTATKSTEKTLRELLGCSPDEADATVLAAHAVLHPQEKRRIGAVG